MRQWIGTCGGESGEINPTEVLTNISPEENDFLG